MATIHTFSSTNSKFNFLVGLYYIIIYNVLLYTELSVSVTVRNRDTGDTSEIL